ERLLPQRWGDRRRSGAGAGGCVAAMALLLARPVHDALLTLPLGLLGLALGVFVPANNTLVMRALPQCDAGAGGGMVNMTRGLG
ncbi:MFS transporter, partial [Streptomyces tateyamensis]